MRNFGSALIVQVLFHPHPFPLARFYAGIISDILAVYTNGDNLF